MIHNTGWNGGQYEGKPLSCWKQRQAIIRLIERTVVLYGQPSAACSTASPRKILNYLANSGYSIAPSNRETL